jgi:acyl-CoA thioesterase FadM
VYDHYLFTHDGVTADHAHLIFTLSHFIIFSFCHVSINSLSHVCLLACSQYKFPVTHPDTLLVGATITSPCHISSNRFTLSHTIWSLQNNLVAAEGHSTVVSYDFKKEKTVDFPPSLKAAIHEVLKKDSLHLIPAIQL